MSKDPAFLFYHHDFLVGTTFMTFEEKGAYITLLCFMADRGSLTKEEIQRIIPPSIWSAICSKFIEHNGRFLNKRLQEEVEKRRNFTESRRKNLHMDKHMDTHMESHMVNVNVNRNVNKDVINKGGIVKGRKQRFVKPTIEQVKQYCAETKSKIDPEGFWHNYESTGWVKANGQSVKNWKSTIKTWEKRDERTGTHNQNTGNDLERIERKKQLDSLGTEISNV